MSVSDCIYPARLMKVLSLAIAATSPCPARAKSWSGNQRDVSGPDVVGEDRESVPG